MPLVRYEIRNEYGLANPDLYRAAAKDDPEGLLEGVAMAGLVGIIRQLGDLAEFAAEVFHDLHEEILATAARGHELMIRVQQLESEIPLIEKMMLTEAKVNHENFIYNQGVVWHAVIRNDQNHFTQGDLPHFIRNAYEECRGPPRLFMLDKFDVAGAGACLKRYTDPFFFKMEWASTELMKAEKEQLDKRARRIKKKRQAVDITSRTSENGILREKENGLRMPKGSVINPVFDEQVADAKPIFSDNTILKPSEYFSTLPEDAALRIFGDAATETTEAAAFRISGAAMAVSEETASEGASVRMLKDAAGMVPEDTLLMDSQDVAHALGKSESITLRISENTSLGTSDDAVLRVAEIEDFASETENFVDALATMDSEVETDTEMKMNSEDEERNGSIASKYIYSDSLTATDSKDATAESKSSCNRSQYEEPEAMISHSSETFHINEEAAALLQKKSERVFPHTESIVGNDERSVHISDSSEGMAVVQQTCELSAAGNKESRSVGYSRDERQERVEESHVTDDGFISSVIEEDNILSSMNGSVTSNVSERNDTMSKSGDQYESESSEDILDSNELAGVVGNKTVETESLSTLSPLPFGVSRTDESENMSARSLSDGSTLLKFGGSRSLSPDRQSTKVFRNGALLSDIEKYNFEHSENELSDSSLKETSPHSSADSSIKPIKWSTKSHDNTSDSDDEMDAMQVSSASSSTLSSPRPSTLATAFNEDQERSKLTLSSERPVEGIPVSYLPHSPTSVASTVSTTSQRAVSTNLRPVRSTDSLRILCAEPLGSLNSEQSKPTVAEPCATQPEATISLSTTFSGSLHDEPSKFSSEVIEFPLVESSKFSSEPYFRSASTNVPNLSQSKYCLSTMSSSEFPEKDGSFGFDDPEKFPPPPPLPPLQWRMSKKFQSTASKDKESQYIPVHRMTRLVPDAALESVDHLVKESPVSRASESHRTTMEVPELPNSTLVIKHSSQSATIDVLENTEPPSPSGAFETSIMRSIETHHGTSLAFPDGASNAMNIVSPQGIRPTVNPTSFKIFSGRPDMDLDQLVRLPIETNEEDALVMGKLDERKPFEVSPGLSINENTLDPKELSESLENSRDNTVLSRASSTSPWESSKLPIRAEGPLQPSEKIQMKHDPHTSSINGKDIKTDVRTAVFPSDIRGKSTLFKVENVGEGMLISGCLESMSSAAESVVTCKNVNESVSLASNDAKVPGKILEGSLDPGLRAPQVIINDLPSADTSEVDQAVNSNPVVPINSQRNDSLIEAIASHDKNTLRKVPERSQSSRAASSDDRGVLLEQIRNRSFNLRQIKVEKQAGPRAVTNINVAAILEKANAIRQAFAGSDDDEDDDWSDG